MFDVLVRCPGGGACRVVGYAAHIRFFDVLTAFWVYACQLPSLSFKEQPVLVLPGESGLDERILALRFVAKQFE
ncbi:MAG: hypothetical protein C5S45_02010 [Candidatus Methanocomedens sp.]|nr:MAG: hypothetical protein C5S45_02010 [ANME-2 cluster archaeon]